MSYFPTNQGYIGCASQGTQKTTAATVTKFVQYLSDDSTPEFDEQVLQEGGDGQYTVSVVKTQHRENVAFSMYARPVIAPQMYAALLGQDTPSHLTTSPFYHTIIPQSWQCTTPVQDWLTVEKMLTCTTNSRVHRVTGVKLSSVGIEAEAGMPVTMTVEGTGITGSLVTTAATPSYETVNPFSFYHGTFHVNAPTTSFFDIKSFNITLTAANDEGIQTTELTRRDIINHRFNAEVTLGINYTSYSTWAKANYGAGTSPTEDYSDGSVNVILKTDAATTSERRLAINIPKVRLKPIPVTLNPFPETMMFSMAGIALKQSTTALVTVTAYNMVATTMPL